MACLKNIAAQVLVFSLLCAVISAAPTPFPFNGTALVKRDGQDEQHPLVVHININGWENTAEEDCFAWLCIYGAKRVL